MTWLLTSRLLPNEPLNLATSNVTSTSLTLAWDEVSYPEGISSYEIFRDGVSVGTSATNSFNDSGLTTATTYVYEVKAIGSNGLESGLSEPLSVTTA